MAEALQEENARPARDELKMIIPIRCFSCGKPVAHLWEKYKERIKKGESRKDIMDSLGLDRYCCRALFMGHIDLIEEMGGYKRY